MEARTYDVALCFAGEDRAYVERVANKLRENDVDYFYDEHEAVELWGTDLSVNFDAIYRKKARLAVLFVSKYYATKAWPRHEFRSALARAVEEAGAYLLPVRLDDAELEGLRPTVGYLDGRKFTPEEVAAAIEEKLGGRTSAPAAPPAARIATGATETRRPRTVPADFNPYAEAERAVAALRVLLSEQGNGLSEQGFVFHHRNTPTGFEIRVMSHGAVQYGLDVWFGDACFGDNATCFNDAGGGGRGMTATGKVEWDKGRGLPVVSLLNFSLLDDVGTGNRLTAEELADAIWEKLCRRLEQ